MSNILGGSNLDVKYVANPNAAGQAQITFSSRGGSALGVNEALFIDSIQFGVQRSVIRKYLLNAPGTVMILGRGQTSLVVSGLFGKPEQFKTLFGDDLSNPCSVLMNAVVNAALMTECSNTGTPLDTAAKLVIYDLVAQSVNITSQISQDGVIFYNANASFVATRLEVQ